MSVLPFLIEKFSKIESKDKNGAKQILMNFTASLNDSEIQSISNDEFVKNFSVKKLPQDNEISGLAKFTHQRQKESFLDKWKNKIKNYDISLDEID